MFILYLVFLKLSCESQSLSTFADISIYIDIERKLQLNKTILTPRIK